MFENLSQDELIEKVREYETDIQIKMSDRRNLAGFLVLLQELEMPIPSKGALFADLNTRIIYLSGQIQGDIWTLGQLYQQLSLSMIKED